MAKRAGRNKTRKQRITRKHRGPNYGGKYGQWESVVEYRCPGCGGLVNVKPCPTCFIQNEPERK